MAESSAKAALFGIRINRVEMAEAVDQILNWCHDGSQGPCRLVVTPNVDHLVLLRRSSGLRAVYANADLVLADGVPLVVASRWLGQPLPGRVAGSDLVPAIFDASANFGQPLRVYLLGAADGVADVAAANVEKRWKGVTVTGTYSPPWGFEHDDDECQNILGRIRNAAPDLLLVGLGAPKQELWVHRFRRELSGAAAVAMCAGATIDFLAGSKKRAPEWMRSSGLEWFYRLADDPTRLASRYAHDAVVFPQLLWQERALLRAARHGGLGPVSAMASPVIDLRQPEEVLDVASPDLPTPQRNTG